MSTWFTEARLAWIKETIEIFGFINRAHIQRKFGVSTPQASYDLRDAQARWPCLMAYDKHGKQYLAVPDTCLTAEEQAAQAERCGCRGSDDMCPCQNVADFVTRVKRAEAREEQAKP